MSTYRVVRIADLAAGDVLRAWEDGDPWTGTVAGVTRRALPTRKADVFWVYDVAYEGGHVAYSLNGSDVRKVVAA